MKKKSWVLLIVLSAQMQLATSSFVFFAPQSVYPSWKEIDQRSKVFQTVINDKTVLLTNGNQPYTDFFTYFDALSVRPPFSDSYIDEVELQEYKHLQRMRDTLTPNWNSVYRVRSINGYVSLLPKEIDARWRVGNEPLLNSIPPIDPALPKLEEESVDYYFVDRWFPGAERFQKDQRVARIEPVDVYALPTRERASYPKPVTFHETLQAGFLISSGAIGSLLLFFLIKKIFRTD